MAKKAKAMPAAKCSCTPANFIWVIIAVLIMGIGLWFLVGGVQGQWSGDQTWQVAIIWYALGFLILGIGKMFKWKACSRCSVHRTC